MKSPLNMKLFLVCVFTLSIQFVALAQVGNPHATDPDVPITGIEILIGAGVLLGIKKLTSFKNKK